MSVTAPRPRRLPQPAARDSGMATSEYALVTVAACALAAVLYAIVTSSEVNGVLTALVVDALRIGGQR